MNRKELYNALETRIREQVPEVKHIELWNRNVEFVEQDTAWDLPAVFVEFGRIDWRLFTDKSYRGSGRLLLHIVTEWTGEEPFSLTDKVVSAIDGLDGETFDNVSLLSTYTNHDHEELVESIEEFGVRYLR